MEKKINFLLILKRSISRALSKCLALYLQKSIRTSLFDKNSFWHYRICIEEYAVFKASLLSCQGEYTLEQ